jgi:hypothetical protein
MYDNEAQEQETKFLQKQDMGYMRIEYMRKTQKQQNLIEDAFFNQ